MKITNKLNLPTPFVSMASQGHIYRDKVYSVTSLLKGTKELMLERRHDSEIEVDVADMVWMLFGTAVHNILEKYEANEEELKEERIEVPIGKYILTGRFDLYNNITGIVTDYKTASVWKIIYGDYKDWRMQTLIYCYMMRKLGFNEATDSNIVAFLKDHNKRDAKMKKDYPQHPVHVEKFHFTENDFIQCEKWLENRFTEIEVAEQLPDDEIPECTQEERYNVGNKYAVMKTGKKTALRVLDTKEEAKIWMKENDGDTIVERLGEDKKCMEYCNACEFCNYYKKFVKPMNNTIV